MAHNLMIERNREILAMAKQGDSLEAIGQRYKLTRERVRQVLAQQGYCRAEKLDHRISEAVERVRQGEDSRMVATQCRINFSTLARHCRSEGVVFQNPRRERKGVIRRLRMIVEVLKGRNHHEIASEMRIPLHWVVQIASDLRQAGADIPKNKYYGRRLAETQKNRSNGQ